MRPRAAGWGALALLLLGMPAWSGQTLPARLDWAGLRSLSLLAAAPVVRVDVRPGQRVKAGALLVETDPGLLEADLAVARAALAEEEVRFAEARREHERNRELYARTVLSQHALQVSEAAWKAAQRRLAAARAEVRRREKLLAWSRLRAPVDGRVVAVHVRPGEVVQSACRARPILELAAADAMDAVFEWNGDGPLPARVQVRVHQRAWPAVCRPAGAGRRGVRVRCRMHLTPEAADRLWAGMPAEVVLP
ncbi:MAG: biotin/lipoyl-binding protein [Gammaproteobacteria bacterium]|nr:MAG: biotin/lipoyl-binding protein [Gammaproteobacteria bacterium]